MPHFCLMAVRSISKPWSRQSKELCSVSLAVVLPRGIHSSGSSSGEAGANTKPSLHVASCCPQMLVFVTGCLQHLASGAQQMLPQHSASAPQQIFWSQHFSAPRHTTPPHTL